LIHGHNPYSVSDLEREYLSEGGQKPSFAAFKLQTITLCVNVPTALVFAAPFAALPWKAACVLWMLLTGAAFIAAILLMWDIGARIAPDAATVLACLFAVNCEAIFCAGNTAGIVMGFCVIAVWCLLHDRLVWLGVLCLGLGIAVKPHDAGFIWLYFLLAGGAHRKRAFRSLIIAAAIGIAGLFWLSHVAPNWMQDWHANMAAISTPDGINSPSLNSVTGRAISSVVDLQAVFSIFRDDPRFYNPATYLLCGAALLVWIIHTLRSRFTVRAAWLALAAAIAFEMIITYHRPWDAKLIMLAIPPCCMLWARRDRIGKIAFAVTTAAILLAGDIPLTVLKTIADAVEKGNDGFGGHLLMLALRRPVPIALLAMGVFYLWVYLTSEGHAVNAAASDGHA
jgi:hypothetical protein